jgi:uncharacterized protein (DUF1015 family)
MEPSFGPVRHAWLSTGGTDDRNYDEFATLDEVAARLREAPDSIAGVEMPQASAGGAPPWPSFADSLDHADEVLRRLRATAFREVGEGTFGYTIAGGGRTATGVVCSAATDLIARDRVPRVVRNEDVFRSKVEERVALLQRTRHLASCVQLIVDGAPAEALRGAVGSPVPGAVTGTDLAGAIHTVWPLPDDAARAVHRALAEASAVVADGNHRSLAAQVAGLDRFLCAVFPAEDMRILAYDRAIRSARSLAEVVTALEAPGGELRFTLVGADGEAEMGWPAPAGNDVALVHRVVEDRLIGGVLGMAPDDERVAYVAGADADAAVRALVADGSYDLGVLIPPVPVSQFVAVNERGVQMPRKSTWFVPKVRAGFVLSEV